MTALNDATPEALADGMAAEAEAEAQAKASLTVHTHGSTWLHMAQESLGIPRKTYFYKFFWIFGVFLIKY